MLQQFLRHVNDQFDWDRQEAEKLADTLAERKEALKEASHDQFAVVLNDGREKRPKFPVQTETDIQMSKEALDRSREEMPDEVVKTAEYFIDQHSREKCAEPAFERRPDPQATNIVYVGSIDKAAWERKQDKTARPSETITIDGVAYPLDTEQHVKAAEKLIASTPMPTEDRCKVAGTLIDKAREVGAELTKEAVRRFNRSSVPVRFEEHVEARRERAADELEPLYDELKKQASSLPLPEVAEKLSLLDQVAGFAPMEGEKMANHMRPTAYDVVFPTNEDPRSEADLSKVANLFGKDFAENYKEKGESALDALSNAEQQLFRDALREG